MDDQTPMPDTSALARYVARLRALESRIDALPPAARRLVRAHRLAIERAGRSSATAGQLPAVEEFVAGVEAAVEEVRCDCALQWGKAAGYIGGGSGA